MADLAINRDFPIIQGSNSDRVSSLFRSNFRRIDHGSRTSVLAVQQTQRIAGFGQRPEIGDSKGRRLAQAVATTVRRGVIITSNGLAERAVDNDQRGWRA